MNAAPHGPGNVALVEDDDGVRAALGALLAYEGHRVDGHADPRSLLQALDAGAPAPDCVLCDVKMPHMDGLELQQALARAGHASLPMVFMSGQSGAPEVVSAFRAGAIDFLLKPIRDDSLLAAVDKALALGRQLRQEALGRAQTCARVARLSARELEVARQVAAGVTTTGIALQLGISEPTVKFHRRNVLEKLGLAGTPDLVRLLNRYDALAAPGPGPAGGLRPPA